jgi:hypothetical protein
MAKEIDYVELLKLAHEKLGSQSDMIAELEKECVNAKNYMVDLSKTIINYSSQIEKLEMKVLEYSIALSAPDEIRDLEQQVMGRLDGVAYALNMYCTTMSPKEFPPIGEYYAGQLQAKALKAEPKTSSEGAFWVDLEESLNKEEALKEQE